MNRVCLVRGPAQLLFLMAGLRQQRPQISRSDHLVLAGMDVSADRKVITEKLARIGWPWASIVWASDILDEKKIRASTDPLSFGCDLRQRAGLGEHIDELWFCMPRGLAEQALMIAWPAARLVLCDDGLGTYVHQKRDWVEYLRNPRALARRGLVLAGQTAYRLPMLRTRTSHSWPNRPIAEAYLFLEGLPKPDFGRETILHTVSTEVARNLVFDVQKALDISGPPSIKATKPILLLGQYFHKSGSISWEEELEIYAEICRLIFGLGAPVLWKEHPKSPKPFHGALKAIVPGLENAGIDGRFEWPIEFFADRLGLRACVCGTSTCLFTLPRIHGIPTFTFASRFVDRLTGIHLAVANMAVSHADALDKLLQQGEWAHA